MDYAFLDHDGHHMKYITSRLRRAMMPLELDWVRDFMAAFDEPTTNVTMLTSPLSIASAHMFKGYYRVRSVGIDLSCFLHFLFVPCATVGEYTVGLCVHREGLASTPTGPNSSLREELDDAASGAMHCVGRYCFSTETGELLMLSHMLEAEKDMSIPIVTHMMQCVGPVDEEAITSLGSKYLIHVAWFSAVDGRQGRSVPSGFSRNEKIAVFADRELLLRGAYAESIVVGDYSAESRRYTCTKCSARAMTSLSPVHIARGQAACECRVDLMPARAVLDFSGLGENMRVTCGLWNGAAYRVCHSQSWLGPLIVSNATFTIAMDLSGDRTATSQLLTLALKRSMVHSHLVRQVMPDGASGSAWTLNVGKLPGDLPSANSGKQACASAEGLCMLTSITDGGAVESDEEHSALRLCLRDTADREKVGEEPSAIGGSGLMQAQAPLEHLMQAGMIASRTAENLRRMEARMAERKRKNRESASRSNAKRKLLNDSLKAAVRLGKQRVLELRRVEMELRAENVELRRELLGSQRS